jgi:type I restriction enzyme S subunit
VKLSPYPAYKDSGVEWLGKMPEHWRVSRLKHVSSLEFSSVDKHSIEGETPVRLCNYSEVYNNDFVTPDMDFMEATATPDEIRQFALRKNDVLLTKDSETWDDIAVPALVQQDMSDVLCGYHLAVSRPRQDKALGAYLFRAIGARGINDQFMVAATGVTRFGVGKYDLGVGLLPVPPIPEQRIIAAFLDRETAKIDALVAKKEKLIELLLEKRTALISHAVTKGLDPNVPMKESGVQRLGSIPEHWEVKKVWMLFRMGRGRVISHEEILEHPGAYPVYSSQTESDGVMGYIDTYDFSGKFLTWTTDGAQAGTVFSREGRFNCTNVCGTLQAVGDGTDRRFFRYALDEATSWFVRHDINPKLMNNVMAKIRVQVPPDPEQSRIADRLDRETAKTDVLVVKIREGIEKLKEYRAALISAAVTGKIDVRGVLACQED